MAQQVEKPWKLGLAKARAVTLVSSLAWRVYPREDTNLPKGVPLTINGAGVLHINPKAPLSENEWAYVFVHMLLHTGYGHHMIPSGVDERAWNLACDLVLEGILKSVPYSAPLAYKIPESMRVPGRPMATRDYCERLMREVNLADYGQGDIVRGGKKDLKFQQQQKDRTDYLARGIRQAAIEAIDGASGKHYRDKERGYKTRSDLIMSWFMANYPLLSPFAAGVKIIEDKEECERLDVRVAAVQPSKNIIYINPMAPLNEEELKFVLAHEILHIALMHEQRLGARDRYLYNVATDYVINRWLVELGLGKIPKIGLLYDTQFDGMSADEIYDILKKDLRRAKRLQGFRGKGVGDIIYDPDFWDRSDGVTRDEWVRMSLSRGLDLHRSRSRGLLPGDFEQEIESLAQPPIAWDAQLAQWFQSHFPPRLPMRTYSRISRRQGSTPDIPRPGRLARDPSAPSYVFTVLLDTSGSMDEDDLGKALGAVASYAFAHEVDQVRMIYCDAAPNDGGWMEPETLSQAARVRGRGGTALQPGIDYMQTLDDLPQDAPLLIITDGWIEDNIKMHSPREHAWLLAPGCRLPFATKAPVFEMN